MSRPDCSPIGPHLLGMFCSKGRRPCTHPGHRSCPRPKCRDARRTAALGGGSRKRSFTSARLVAVQWLSRTSRRSRNRWSTLVGVKALWQTINQVSCTISLPRTEARQVSDGPKSPPGQGGGMFHIWHAGADCLRSAPPATVLGLDGPTFRRQGQGDGVV
jgi:hypothetical protein